MYVVARETGVCLILELTKENFYNHHEHSIPSYSAEISVAENQDIEAVQTTTSITTYGKSSDSHVYWTTCVGNTAMIQMEAV